jgi:hypothetical protein
MTHHKKQLNSKVPSYRQKSQYQDDMRKTKEREKINPKKIFDGDKKKSSKKTRGQKKKY